MDNLESYFLGLIWGDGNIDKGRVKIHCHSEETKWHSIIFDMVAELIEFMLIFSGLPVKLSTAGNCFVVPFYGYKSFNFVRENIPMKHPRKKQKLLDILSSYKQYSWGFHDLVEEV